MQKQVKSKVIRGVMAFLLAVILIMSSVAPLFADELDDLESEKQGLEDQAAQNQAEQAATQEQIAQVEAEIAAVGDEITALDAQITECVNNITELKAKIADNEELIAQTQTELQKAKEDENEHYEELKARMQMMYEYGNVNYLEILLGSKSISEFFSRIEYVNQMADYDKQIQDNLEADRQKIQGIEAKLEQKQLELDIDQSRLEKEKETLETAMQEKEAKYAELEDSRETYVQYLNTLTEKEADIQQLIADVADQITAVKERQAQEDANKNNNTGGGSSTGGGGSSGGGSVSEGIFTWPVPSSYYVASSYGWRVHPIYGYPRLHAGTDIGADYGDAIVAADSGTVIYTGYDDGGYGNFLMIQHASGYVTLYAHCNQLLVYSGQYVSRGETIALVGSTGASTGPHCHFEVRVGGNPIDAMDFF